MSFNCQHQRGASLLEYALLIALILTVATGAIMYMGRQTKKAPCLLIGAFEDPRNYGTAGAATKWNVDTQTCSKNGENGWEPLF